MLPVFEKIVFNVLVGELIIIVIIAETLPTVLVETLQYLSRGTSNCENAIEEVLPKMCADFLVCLLLLLFLDGRRRLIAGASGVKNSAAKHKDSAKPMEICEWISEIQHTKYKAHKFPNGDSKRASQRC